MLMIIVWPLIAFSYPEDYLLDNYWRLLGLEKLPLWKFYDVYDYFFSVIENSFWPKRVNLDSSACNCSIPGWVHDYEWLSFYP